MNTQQHYDLIIIGGGPIGLACGLEAQKKGLQYLILEKGCLVNSLFHYPTNMTFFSTSEKLEIGGVPFVSNNIKPTRPEALEYYRRVAVSNRLHIKLEEKVVEVLPAQHLSTTATSGILTAAGVAYEVITVKNSYSCANIIIATGFYDIPVLMDIPGELLPKVTHYYKEPHSYAMHKVIVVGANNSAVDAALETYRKGADVTMVTRGPAIGERVKYWVKPDIENRIKEGSIKAYFNSYLSAINANTAEISTPDGPVTIENDYVIAMTGYQPDFAFLRNTGIRLSDDGLLQPDYHPETMESNLPHVYLAGVVCGGMNTHVWFIENSREHAERIIAAIVK